MMLSTQIRLHHIKMYCGAQRQFDQFCCVCSAIPCTFYAYHYCFVTVHTIQITGIHSYIWYPTICTYTHTDTKTAQHHINTTTSMYYVRL